MPLSLRYLCLLCLLSIVGLSHGLCHELTELNRVDVAPITKWFHIASVTLTPNSFIRTTNAFTADYKAEIIPFSFYDEVGTLRISIVDSDLKKLLNNESISFKGAATNSEKKIHLITGEVIPKTISNGTLKVKLYYNSLITLSFVTSYSLPLLKSEK